jgi:hypothetical protein
MKQFMTTIDGLDIHFIHVRSKHDLAPHRHAPARAREPTRHDARALTKMEHTP